MSRFEVQKLPKVVIKSAQFGVPIKPIPASAEWFVVVERVTGEHYYEFDEEADAVARCEELNARG